MKTKTITLNSKNIESVIKQMNKSYIEFNQPPQADFIVAPISTKLLSRRYRGLGRPRKTDYDFRKINWKKIMKSLPPSDFLTK